MDKVRLANGKEYKCISFGVANVGYLFIRVDMTLSKAATTFGANTERIEYHPEGGDPIAINGFTQLDYIVNEGDCVRVALKQPVNMEAIGDAS